MSKQKQLDDVVDYYFTKHAQVFRDIELDALINGKSTIGAVVTIEHNEVVIRIEKISEEGERK